LASARRSLTHDSEKWSCQFSETSRNFYVREIDMRSWFYGALIIVTASTPALSADPDHGKTLAQRWCVGCHLVGPEQRNATTDAPPFASVARRPDFDESRLAFFLLDPHPKMPNMQLTRDDAGDLAAYIASLGPHGRTPKTTPPKGSRRAGDESIR
jgi:mono/diheme cytochrome c family protein